MRKPIVVAALVAGSLSFGAFGAAVADQLPAGVEGCVVRSSPAGGGTVTVPGAGANLYDSSCTFTATRTGGFVGGASSWRVTVVKDGDPAQTTVFSGSNEACNTGAYDAKDVVKVELTNGLIAAGNPFPSATDGTLTAGGDRCP